MMLQGFEPVVGPASRLLVLGSFPGEASLKAGRYYAHPRNQFWPILAQVLGQPLLDWPFERRYQAVIAAGLGIWDVYAACEREGSLDTSIRNAERNDFGLVRRECPGLVAIAHNGGESFRHAKYTQALGLPVHKLPSTSPANASWSFDRKLAAWGEVFRLYGLA